MIVDQDDYPSYKGPDRRYDSRRKTADRRQDIRFEPEKEDRRQVPGRRKGDNTGWRRSDI